MRSGIKRYGLLSAALVAGVLLFLSVRPQAADEPSPLAPVSSVASVGMTVSDMTRAVEFYTNTLAFKAEYDVEVAGRPWEQLHGVFGARMRIVGLRLGDERLELTEYLAPKGRPYPSDSRGNDLWFQHVAIIVSDMTKAYAWLRARGVVHASTGPQRLPEWNAGAAGIEAFYFRDPDGHFLEILSFPPGKGDAKWHQATTDLFLGIDHTAITVRDTDTALEFYRHTLGLKVVGEGENYGIEQEHLNNVFGVRLRITTLRAARGTGVELLDYRAPRDGRPAPLDLKANDLAHWQMTMVGRRIGHLLEPSRLFSLVSPDVTSIDERALGFTEGLLVRDPDGHGVRVVDKASQER